MAKRLIAVFDMDDTLSDTAHRRHLVEPPEGVKKDWEGFYKLAHLDAERTWMIQSARELLSMGVEIAIFTGRPENGRRSSIKWLAEREIEPTISNFRRFRDFRKTAKMKGDWMAELLASEDVEVVCAVDDEPTNIAAFKAAGVCAIDATDEPAARTLFEQVKARVTELKAAAPKAPGM